MTETKKACEQNSMAKSYLDTLFALTALFLVSPGFTPFMWHYRNFACYSYRSERYDKRPIKCNENWAKLL